MRIKLFHKLLIVFFLFSIISCNNKNNLNSTNEMPKINSIQNNVSKNTNPKSTQDFETADKLIPMADDKAHRAVAMLNHLAVQTELILESKNNKLLLEEIYNNLINNIAPKSVDEDTKIQIDNILDTINNLRLLDVDREHLQILYENDVAHAINQALPDPSYLLSTVISGNILKSIASTAMMGLSSWSNYQSAKDDAKLDLLKENWKLDKEEANEINELRIDSFNYMVDIANSFDEINSEDTLSEEKVKNFVNWKLLDNPSRRKLVLEGTREEFEKYGPYWGLLGQTYYELGEYKNCIIAINNYEKARAKIFRNDIEFANTIPYAILSLGQIYNEEGNEYFIEMEKYLTLLENETKKDNWQMRYFISQCYISLAGKKSNSKEKYLKKAFDIVKLDLSNLATEQERRIAQFLTPIDERIPDDKLKSEKKKLQQEIAHKKQLKSETLIPYHEGLINALNLYRRITSEFDISDYESQQINSAVNRVLGILFERDFVLNTNFDDNNILTLMEKYSDNITSIKSFERIYNVFQFRSRYTQDFSNPDDVMNEIIQNFPNNPMNYYIPSLYNSYCSYENPLFDKPYLELGIPLCLLKNNTELDVVIVEGDENEEYTQFYMEENVTFSKNIIINENIDYVSDYDSPIYFQWCYPQLYLKTDKLKFDKHKNYKAVIFLVEDDSVITALRFCNINQKNNGLSNFEGFVE